MEKNIEKIVCEELQNLLKNYIPMKQFDFKEIREFKGDSEGKKDLIRILDKVFYILTKREHREKIYLDINDARDYRTDTYFQVNFAIDLSEHYYMIHKIEYIDVNIGSTNCEYKECNAEDSECLYCDNYEIIDCSGASLGFTLNTDIIEHEQCKLHVIGTIELNGGFRVNDIDFLFDTIATMKVEGIGDSSIIEKYYWLDYMLRAINNYEKDNYILAFFNLFAGFDAFIEGVNEEIFHYYLDNYVRLKYAGYKVFNRRDVSDVDEYLIKEIKNFGNDSRRLSDKLVSILNLIGIDKNARKKLQLVNGNNFKQREKIRNSIAHGTLTKIKAEESNLDAEWFENEFLYFVQVIVKILDPSIDVETADTAMPGTLS